MHYNSLLESTDVILKEKNTSDDIITSIYVMSKDYEKKKYDGRLLPGVTIRDESMRIE